MDMAKNKEKDLENKKIVCSIYHIDEDKLDKAQLMNFKTEMFT